MFVLLTKALRAKRHLNSPRLFFSLGIGAKTYLDRNRDFLKTLCKKRSKIYSYEDIISLDSLLKDNHIKDMVVYSFDLLGPEISRSIRELYDYIMDAFSNTYQEDPLVKNYVMSHSTAAEPSNFNRDIYLQTLARKVSNIDLDYMSGEYNNYGNILCELLYKKDCSITTPIKFSYESLPLLYWLICFMRELNNQRKIKLNTVKDHISFKRIEDVLTKIVEYFPLINICESTCSSKDTLSEAIKKMSIKDKKNLAYTSVITASPEHINFDTITSSSMLDYGFYPFLYINNESGVKFIPDDYILKHELSALRYFSLLGSILKAGQDDRHKVSSILGIRTSSPKLTTFDFYETDLPEKFGCNVFEIDSCSGISIKAARTSCDYAVPYADTSYRKRAANICRSSMTGYSIVTENIPPELIDITEEVNLPVLNIKTIIKNYRKEYLKISRN